MLQIYDTLAREKRVFVPTTPGCVNIYVCGVTVYDYCHIGHARTYIAFDVIIRYLQFLGYQVTYVRNITDIDDKIIAKAISNNVGVEDITAQFIAAMHEDFAALGLVPADYEPRATEYIKEMCLLVEKLLDLGYAYLADNGDVYYDVLKFAAYGQISHRKLADLQAGARIEVNKAKGCPLDFVLWKRAKPGEPAWESPWGLGRPGWHLECSAMALSRCSPVDIHGGGLDLAFPHHENECAQSEAATGVRFVNYRMHIGFLQIDQAKMSKSLGNFTTIREILAYVNPEVLRLFMLMGHYRSPVEYSQEQLDLSRSALERLYLAIRGFNLVKNIINTQEADKKINIYTTSFRAAMDDDFNTAEAIAVLFDMAKEINRSRDLNTVASIEYATSIAILLKKLAGILGLLQQEPESFLRDLTNINLEIEDINKLIMQREQARGRGDWGMADAIRHNLSDLGILLEDAEHGTTWRRK